MMTAGKNPAAGLLTRARSLCLGSGGGRVAPRGRLGMVGDRDCMSQGMDEKKAGASAL